jgi:hypothetical protein
MAKPIKPIFVQLSDDAADDLFVKLLRYWDRMLKPMKGEWEHPDDVPLRKKRQKAIKVLLDYMT